MKQKMEWNFAIKFEGLKFHNEIYFWDQSRGAI